MVVNVKNFGVVETYVLLSLTANARDFRKTEDHNKFGIGYNVFVTALAAEHDLKNLLKDRAPEFLNRGKKGAIRILPVGYGYWTPARLLNFAAQFTKMVVNEGWLPDPQHSYTVEFVQELFNCAASFEVSQFITNDVVAAYKGARSYGLFEKQT